MAVQKNERMLSFTTELLIVDLLVVLYAICYQLQAPLEPYLVDRLVKNAGLGGDASASYATLQSFFSLVQVIGSLFIGALIDRLGLRTAFVLNFVACAASYGLLANVETMNGLYLSKVPTVFMTGFLCAQTAVVKMTKPGTERVSQLGRLTMAYTIGGTLGPSLGGYLGTNIAAKLAVAGSIGAALLVMALPSKVDNKEPDESSSEVDDNNDSNESIGKVKNNSSSKAQSSSPSWMSSAVLGISITWPFLLIKFLGTVANSMNRSISPLIFKNIFLLSEAELGLIMSSVFFATALVSMVLGQITEIVGSESRLIKICILGLTLGYAAQSALFHPFFNLLNIESSNQDSIEAATGATGAISSNIQFMKYCFTCLSCMLALFQFPLATTITSQSTSLVSANIRGTLVGIEHSLYAFAGICGPSFGVLVMKSYDVSGVAAMAMTSFFIAFLVFILNQKRLSGMSKKSKLN